jgi:hypothetical protein
MHHFQCNLVALGRNPSLQTFLGSSVALYLGSELEATNKPFCITKYVISVNGVLKSGIAISVDCIDQLSFLNVYNEDDKILAPLNSADDPYRNPILDCKPGKEVSFLSWAEVKDLASVAH